LVWSDVAKQIALVGIKAFGAASIDTMEQTSDAVTQGLVV
jgi:hypothetical protein